jgi:hypothetical protein
MGQTDWVGPTNGWKPRVFAHLRTGFGCHKPRMGGSSPPMLLRLQRDPPHLTAAALYVDTSSQNTLSFVHDMWHGKI